MSSSITIRVYPSEIEIDSLEKEMTIPLQNLGGLRQSSLDWARQIAGFCERYGLLTRLNNTEFDGVLKNLTDIGLSITHCIFGSRWGEVEDLVKRHPVTAMRIIGSPNVWIPWELLCFDGEQLAPNRFLGFRRNIFRVPPSQGRKLELASSPTVGFLAHAQAPYAQDEYTVLRRQSKGEGTSECNWPHLVQKSDFLEEIKRLNIVHFAGLITPVQYLEKSFVLVDTNMWTSLDDLVQSPTQFSFLKAPLVVFNVRDNYARHPQHVLEYVKLLLDKGAAGVIASEFPVPPALASAFSEHFYNHLLKENRSIDQALAETKDLCIKEYNNPLVMFYAPYFEPCDTGREMRGEAKVTSTHKEVYEDLFIHVGPTGNIKVKSDGGERKDTISLVVPSEVGSTAGIVEQGQQVTASLLKTFGNRLYEIIFPHQIDMHFNVTEATARKDNKRIRIRLTIETDVLAKLPWEFLYREERGHFLSTNPGTVLSHYIDLPLPSGYVKRHEGPLHMLIIISNPKDHETQLDVDNWERIVRDALSKPVEEGRLTFGIVKQATFENIHDALLNQPPDIVQFVGHGVYRDGKGYLALVDSQTGGTWRVDDERFAAIFVGVQDHLGLICLATCESAKSDSPASFLGIAPQLVRRGTPAVVAMRYPVRVTTAEIFLENFYKALAARYPVDWAVQSARNSIAIKLGLSNREFATPVLFMRAKDGNIF